MSPRPDVFICYALERDWIPELQDRIHEITAGAADLGMTAYAYVRDEQSWDFRRADLRAVLQSALERLADARIVLLDLTSNGDSKRTGLSIEAGYAKALGKPIVAIWRDPDRPNMNTDLADFEASYKHTDELRQTVKDLLTRAATSDQA